jgi:hypothetical protein
MVDVFESIDYIFIAGAALLLAGLFASAPHRLPVPEGWGN